MLMGRLHQFSHILFAPKVGVDTGPVADPVAMKPIGKSGSLIGPSVNLFKPGCGPEGCDPQLVEIALLNFLNNPFEITPFKTTQFGSLIASPEVYIIGWIAIVKAICKQKIDICIFPEKGSFQSRLQRNLRGSFFIACCRAARTQTTA